MNDVSVAEWSLLDTFSSCWLGLRAQQEGQERWQAEMSPGPVHRPSDD